MECVRTLVFGGGGVKSIAYLGAMEEMVRLGTNWDMFCRQLICLAGSSAGAFSAVCVAMGKTLPELQALLL